MRYCCVTPRPELAPFVDTIWVQESPGQSPDLSPTTVLPTGRLELLFFFRDPFVHLEAQKEIALPSAMALGQRTKPIIACAKGETGVLIVSFHPWAGESLFRASHADLTDSFTDLEAIVGSPEVASLEDRIAAGRCPEDRVRVVEEYLLGVLGLDRPDALVVESVRRINRSWGRLRVQALAHGLAISRRHLSRRFTQAVGISPKKFSNIVRFQKALACVRAGIDWPELIDLCGYVDQAHFIRELKGFSGQTPRRLGRKRRETPLMRTYNTADASALYSTVYL